MNEKIYLLIATIFGLSLIMIGTVMAASPSFNKAPWERFMFFDQPTTSNLAGGYTDARGATGMAYPSCWPGAPYTAPSPEYEGVFFARCV